ncbi:MAG: Crp/Fnr family transcriptional regulator [Actinomycetota bacterium]|nr:Crp/Fnr family transcriptional regulator [Actinomycetota bacterium]
MESSLLAALPEPDRLRLRQVARRRVFARGEVVFHRGDPADTLHLIVKGRFAVRITTPLGDTAVLTVLSPGEFFGELALLGEAPRSATVAALEPGETLSIHRIDFEALRTRHPQATDFLIEALAKQVRRLSEHLIEALYVPADTRVVRRVREMHVLYGDGAPETVIPLTQEELADLAGTSRATVNRVLRRAERRGAVRLSRGKVVVVDRGKLGGGNR